ncbi:hypothetical protein DXG01_014878, partial [Tephrocybe rancida]
MAMLEAKVEFYGEDEDEDEEDPEPSAHILTTTASLLSKIQLSGGIAGPTRVAVDYFATALQLSTTVAGSSPHHTMVSNSNVAFHLTRDANFKHMSVENVMEKYGLPDLRDAIAGYLSSGSRWISSIGSGLPARPNGEKRTPLVTHLNIWTRVRIQQKEYHYPHNNLPPETVN